MTAPAERTTVSRDGWVVRERGGVVVRRVFVDCLRVDGDAAFSVSAVRKVSPPETATGAAAESRKQAGGGDGAFHQPTLF